MMVEDRADPSVDGDDSESKLLKLPTEVLELIVGAYRRLLDCELPAESIYNAAKCRENDIILLESATSDLVERVEAAGKDKKDTSKTGEDADNGWETESDGESLADGDDTEEDEIPALVPFTEAPNHYASMEAQQRLSTNPEPCEDCGRIHEDEDDSLITRRELPKPPVLAIHQLAKTNRLFRTLALPSLYRGVDFEAMPNRVLQQFIERILPVHANLVQEVRSPCFLTLIVLSLSAGLDTCHHQREPGIRPGIMDRSRRPRSFPAAETLRARDEDTVGVAQFDQNRY